MLPKSKTKKSGSDKRGRSSKSEKVPALHRAKDPSVGDPWVGARHTPVLKSPVSHKDRRLLVSSGEMSARLVLLMLGLDCHVQAVRDTRPASALNRRRILRFQRIDTANRRRMFRPTAEIARRESRYQVPNQYSVEAQPASKRPLCRWSVGSVKK